MRTNGPSQSPLLLLDVIEVLDRLAVRYAIVGAIAAAYHGVVRASRDADAVVSLPLAGLLRGGLETPLMPDSWNPST